MPREEDNPITREDSSKKVTVVRTKMLDRIPTRQRMKVDQTVREIVGLSVAVILGFNIGDGNIRDRLEGNCNTVSLKPNSGNLKQKISSMETF